MNGTLRCQTDLHSQTDGRAAAGQHIDERIGTEQIDSPVKEIDDAGLNHAKCLGYGPLFKAASRDELLDLNHEIRPNQKWFGLVTAKVTQL